MKTTPINTVEDVYHFVERTKSRCQEAGMNELVEQFDKALLLGSSGLEILGSIRGIIINHREAVVQLLGPASEAEVGQVISFVDKMYGR